MEFRVYISTLLAGVALLLALALLSTAKGNTVFPLTHVLGALAGPWANSFHLPDASITLQRIVLDLRVPRVLLALIVGAGLAVVGVLLQTVTRNELADPFLFGLSYSLYTAMSGNAPLVCSK